MLLRFLSSSFPTMSLATAALVNGQGRHWRMSLKHSLFRAAGGTVRTRLSYSVLNSLVAGLRPILKFYCQ